jgi:anti-sigma factor RsiW
MEMIERPHVTSMLESYVIGALSDADVARVEAHVVSCSACAASLQREAELDVAFEAVVSSQRVPARSSTTVKLSSSMALGAALAMAAAMLLWLVPRGDDTHAPSTQETPSAHWEENVDASTFTASLDLQADGASRLGVKD